MANEDTSRALDVYRTLRRAHRLVRRDLKRKLREHGVTWSQLHVLFHIRGEGVTFKKLAAHLHCNASNMTGLIDRMQKNGWVYRERSDEDRRVWLVRLTDEGSELRERLIPEHHRNIRRRMGCLSNGELEELDRLLEKLIAGV